MIGALSGTIFSIRGQSLILSVNGVGYLVCIPERTASTVTVGKTITMFTHTHVRDDALELYGFLTSEELYLFELLLTVSGIGPKTAITVIDRGVDAVRRAVTNADVDFFQTVPRLGKKNAQKIIIELKSKLGSLQELNLSTDTNQDFKSILDALGAMGFSRNEATSTLKHVDTSATLEEKLKQALKLLGKPQP